MYDLLPMGSLTHSIFGVFGGSPPAVAFDGRHTEQQKTLLFRAHPGRKIASAEIRQPEINTPFTKTPFRFQESDTSHELLGWGQGSTL